MFGRTFDVAFDASGVPYVSDARGQHYDYWDSVSRIGFDALLGDSMDVTISQFGGSVAFRPQTLLARDAEEDALTWSFTSAATSGTATITGTGDSVVVNYTPDMFFYGQDGFAVSVDDGNGGTDSFTVNVTVDKNLLMGETQYLNSNAPGDPVSDYNPQLATDGDGTWMAIWTSGNTLDGTLGSEVDVFYSISTDNCLTWSTAAALNSSADLDSGKDYAPQITTDGAGTWIAVWESMDDLDGTVETDFDIHYAVYSDTSATWSPVRALNSNAPDDGRPDFAPQVTTDGKGVWIAVWESGDDLDGTIGSDRDILYSVSTDKGTSWSASLALNSTAAAASDDDSVQLTTDGAGTWMAVWESNDTLGDDYDIVYSVSVDNGGTWSDMAAVNSNAGDDLFMDKYVQVSTDGAGTWIAVWESFNKLGGEPEIDRDIHYAVSTDDGATWGPVAALNSNAVPDVGDDQGPQVTTDGAGNWIAVWESGAVGGGDRDIAYSVSTDAGGSWSAIAALASNAGSDSKSDDNPQLTTDGLGNWVAVWYSKDTLGGTVGTDYDVFYAVLNSAPRLEQVGPLFVTMEEGGVWTAPELSGTDGESDALTWSVLTQAGNGTATVSGTGAHCPLRLHTRPTRAGAAQTALS